MSDVQITDEEFSIWLAQPITALVLSAHQRFSEAQKTAWADRVWASGDIDPIALAEMRTRADAYMAISEMTLADVLAANGLEEEREAHAEVS